MRSDYNAAKRETQESYQVMLSQCLSFLCFRPINRSLQIRIMRVSKLGSDELLEPSKFRTALPGAMVDVTFILRHHYFKGVNSYSAYIQQVIILKSAPPAIPSPFQDRRKGGALSFSQSPRKSPSKAGPSRNEQIAAVNAFGPVSTRAAEKRKLPDSEMVASSSKKAKEVSYHNFSRRKVLT